MSRYVCPSCSYLYDEEIGEPDFGLRAGTAWMDVPEAWICPECANEYKADFSAESAFL